MTTLKTILLPDREILPALEHALLTSRDVILSRQFSAALPTPRSHARYKALWAALFRAPSIASRCCILLNKPTPLSPQSFESNAAARRLIEAGWRVRWHPSARIAHSKSWAFEGRGLIVGSHNLTHAAMTMNSETSAQLGTGDALDEFMRSFLSDWDRSTSVI